MPNAASRIRPRKTRPPTRRCVIAPIATAPPTISDPAGERDLEVDVVDVEHREQAEQAGRGEERADHGCEQRRPLRRPRRRRSGRRAVSSAAGGTCSGRSRLDTRHQTSAAPARTAANQKFPLPGQKLASESAKSAPKPSRPTPRRSQGWSRRVRIVSTAIDSSRVLVRDHEVRGEVEQQAGAAGQRERCERDPVDERVDVEVAAEAGADAAEPAAVVGADEPPRGRLVERWWCRRSFRTCEPLQLDDAHSIDTAAPQRYRASPLSDPDLLRG